MQARIAIESSVPAGASIALNLSAAGAGGEQQAASVLREIQAIVKRTDGIPSSIELTTTTPVTSSVVEFFVMASTADESEIRQYSLELGSSPQPDAAGATTTSATQQPSPEATGAGSDQATADTQEHAAENDSAEVFIVETTVMSTETGHVQAEDTTYADGVVVAIPGGSDEGKLMNMQTIEIADAGTFAGPREEIDLEAALADRYGDVRVNTNRRRGDDIEGVLIAIPESVEQLDANSEPENQGVVVKIP